MTFFASASGLLESTASSKPALRQGVQQLRNAVVGLRFHLRMLLVVRLILRLHRVRQVLPVANRPLRQNLRAVADEVAIFLRLPAGQPVQARGARFIAVAMSSIVFVSVPSKSNKTAWIIKKISFM